MAFGYRYWMVFLPEIEPHSHLLFVRNPAGATKLRNYTSGRERVVGQPGVEMVFRDTQIGRTRHECDPHKTDDHGFWYQKTQELNRRYLGDADRALPRQSHEDHGPANSASNVGCVVPGRAFRGSQRQLQDYVNTCPDALSEAILEQLPRRVRELGASIRWVSPLARDNYREYRDAEFLERVGLGDFAGDLADFWPSMGPSWDALGVISDSLGRIERGIILLEAKSHREEIHGSGCQASGASLYKIDRALAETKEWLDVEIDADWLGQLYQYANRIAHLYFMLKKHATPAWLVNVYFLDDPIGPTTQEEWESEIQNVKNSLGLSQRIPNAVEVFLPALAETVDVQDEPTVRPAEGAGHAKTQESIPRLCAVPPLPDPSDFRSWAQEWMELASYPGPCLRDPEARIERLLSLCKEPVPGSWQRSSADIPSRLLNVKRYTRGDEADPRRGEHRIEREILCQHFVDVSYLQDGRIIDGVNAFPLVRDCGGGRNGNVEADLLLLVRCASGYGLVVAEVKHSANNAWFAAVENLRQLKLLTSGEDAGQLFWRRNPVLGLPANLPITGLVVAPCSFYSQPGRKANSIVAARMLINRTRAEADVDIRLSVWDTQHRTIAAFD